MSRPRGRSDSIREDEALRLPRPPGVLRRFWARHPIVADVLIATACLLLSLGTVGISDSSLPESASAAWAPLAHAATVLGCASLLLRRRVPLVPFVAAVSLELIFLFTMRPGGSPIVLAACYALAVYGSTRAAWTGYGVSVGSVALLTLPLMLIGTISVQAAINTLLNCVILGLIGTLIGVNVGDRKRYLAALIDRSRQLMIERDQQAQLAAAAERARIAREMHDIVSHSLTVIVALSEGAVATPDREQSRRAAATAADTARGALAEMRAMLGVLRDDDSPVPLSPMEPAAPHDTVAAAQRAGYPATLSITGSGEVSPAVAHAVGRIVQEGVTNAMRHAPTASMIAVRLVHSPSTLTIEIVNDGVTGAVGAGGFGVRGLAERAAHVDGVVTSAADGSGRWVLRAELPSARTATAASRAPQKEIG